MISKGEKYCRICGTKLVSREMRYFDVETGKKEIEMICPNVNNCNNACDDAGHTPGFLSIRCKRCGVSLLGGLE